MCWAQDSNLRGISPTAYKAVIVDRLISPARVALDNNFYFCKMVPETGLEPVQPVKAGGF